MSRKLRLFLAHSFANEKLNAEGREDSHGSSDIDLANMISDWIVEFSNGNIEVVRTRDPYQNYISTQVRRDICSSDLMLCLFTKRVFDQLKELWLPSTYVISEASAGLMQYPSHKRLFGLVEERVDREQLGMAFPMNKTAPSFSRIDPNELRCKVKSIVDSIQNNKLSKRNDIEYLSLHKTATIWRNGAITVECRHRFRFTTSMNKMTIPHAIWRVSQPLPPIKTIFNGTRDVERGYLRCVPISCGNNEIRTNQFHLIPKNTGTENEHLFDLEFSNLDAQPGDELVYDIAWGYKGAFQDPSKQDDKPNTVGVLTFERGMVQSAALTLQFQRDLDDDAGEPTRILDEPPIVFKIDTPRLPANPTVFWHEAKNWEKQDQLQLCQDRSGAMWEVFHWEDTCFTGAAKINWTPHFNYLDDENLISTIQQRAKKPKD
ncbi:hypothetical protein [uncultured Gimesia sp.]|uniref:hypothetical protein n=1 Tax=uncultured Gimesia sp. TaxID=1678688 RepID=UPI0026140141|nr:hypothetical protein [uncultured Gimesia sp.]